MTDVTSKWRAHLTKVIKDVGLPATDNYFSFLEQMARAKIEDLKTRGLERAAEESELLEELEEAIVAQSKLYESIKSKQKLHLVKDLENDH